MPVLTSPTPPLSSTIKTARHASIPHRPTVKRYCHLVVLLVLVGCATTLKPPPILSAYPSGAINSDVTQENISQMICVVGWTSTIRPATSYTDAIKLKLFRAQGLADADKTKYELDHYIPLELEGHPKSPDNLWLQPWDGAMGARTKDRLERRLKKMVCVGDNQQSPVSEGPIVVEISRSIWLSQVDPKATTSDCLRRN
jgi:hypothetical protein